MKPENFYKYPEIQKKLLEAIGNAEAMITQTHGGKQVVRRYDEQGEPIKLTKDNFGEWARKHMTEIHPVYGQKTDQLAVDIDPGKDVNWNETRRMTIELVRRMQDDMPGIKDVSVQFSGGRGFYVKGKLQQEIATDQARELTNKMLRQLIEENNKLPKQQQFMNPVMHKPADKQIRLDTSTFHNKGSLRAPYSLNADTGLVSAPVALENLPIVKKQDFTVPKILKNASDLTSLVQILDDVPMLVKTLRSRQRREQAKAVNPEQPPAPTYVEPVSETLKTSEQKEFAPGIPLHRKIEKIPETKEPERWDLAIQKHIADKAGKHFDVRLVDPSGHAHSFAVPKAKLPALKDKMLLAIQQATHTKDYALNFEGNIPKGTYGAGTVTMPIKEKVEILKSNDNSIKFERQDGSQFSLFRTDGKNWGFKKIATSRAREMLYSRQLSPAAHQKLMDYLELTPERITAGWNTGSKNIAKQLDYTINETPVFQSIGAYTRGKEIGLPEKYLGPGRTLPPKESPEYNMGKAFTLRHEIDEAREADKLRRNLEQRYQKGNLPPKLLQRIKNREQEIRNLYEQGHIKLPQGLDQALLNTRQSELQDTAPYMLQQGHYKGPGADTMRNGGHLSPSVITREHRNLSLFPPESKIRQVMETMRNQEEYKDIETSLKQVGIDKLTRRTTPKVEKTMSRLFWQRAQKFLPKS